MIWQRHEIYESLACRGRVSPSGASLRTHDSFRKMDNTKFLPFPASVSAAFAMNHQQPLPPLSQPWPNFSMQPLPTTVLGMKMEESIARRATEPTTAKRRLPTRKLVQLKVPELLRLLKLRLSQVKLPTVMHPETENAFSDGLRQNQA